MLGERFDNPHKHTGTGLDFPVEGEDVAPHTWQNVDDIREKLGLPAGDTYPHHGLVKPETGPYKVYDLKDLDELVLHNEAKEKTVDGSTIGAYVIDAASRNPQEQAPTMQEGPGQLVPQNSFSDFVDLRAKRAPNPPSPQMLRAARLRQKYARGNPISPRRGRYFDIIT